LKSFKKKFEVSEFDRKNEKGKNTMEWGIKNALEKNKKAEIIYDRGSFGKEAMIRIFGIDTIDAINKILAIEK
jgi:hydroxymethylpyrimidine/phosphomethylpyrimidine kinase